MRYRDLREQRATACNAVGQRISIGASFWARVLLLGSLWAGFPAAAIGQVSTATLNGTVRDPSAGAVPQAIVTLKNLETGVERTTETNTPGNYVLLYIPPGRYALEITKQGFKTAKQQEFTLTVNQTSTFDFTLEVGEATDTITVVATGANIETSAAGLGNVITTKEVLDLPLNGRNFTQLLSLNPGVAPVMVAQSSSGFMTNPVGSFSFPSINGQQNRSNNFMLDGINNVGAYVNTYALAPVVDSIQEFKIQSHNDEAEFGQFTGGIVNVVTKSGTNAFHGSVWEFLRNKVLDARSPFLATVPDHKENQFGGTGGGPIVRNRTFFFAGYEGFRQRRAAGVLSLVPTDEQLRGNLSGLPQVYDPWTTREDPSRPGAFIRDPFPGNIIPSNRLNPGAVAWARAVFPTAVPTANPGVNHINNTPTSVRQDIWTFKIDHQINPSNTLWFRYSASNQKRRAPSPVSTAFVPTELDSHNWGVNYVGTISPSAIFQAQFGRNYADTDNGSGEYPGIDARALNNQIGFVPSFGCDFRDSAGNTGQCLVAGAAIIGIATTVPGGTLQLPQSDIWQGKGTFTKILGNHTFKVGGEVSSNNLFAGASTRFNTGFSPQQTAHPQISGTGVGLASFLLGLPNNVDWRNGVTSLRDGWVFGAFFQDSWKVTSKLTMNWGLRWDVTVFPFFGSDELGNNQVANADYLRGRYSLLTPTPSCAERGTAPCIPGGLENPAFVINGEPRVVLDPDGKVFSTDYKNWQPRLGIAYRLTDKTVIRTAFGLFFDNWGGVAQISGNMQGTWPSVFAAQGANMNTPTLSNPLPTQPIQDPFGWGSSPRLLPAATPFAQSGNHFSDPDYKVAYSEQWNFGIQQQVNQTTLLDVNYVGSHGSRLNIGTFYNTARTPGPGNPRDRAPFPFLAPSWFDRSWGRSNYNALQVRLNRRYSDGISYLVSYTWSKALDIACSGWFGVEGCLVQDPYNFNNERGPSGFDLTHIFTGSWLYQLPFGTGGKFKTGNRILDYAIGPWQVNGIVQLTSGIPYEVGITGDIANTGNSGVLPFAGYMRLNQVGDPVLSDPKPGRWFDKGAFAPPPAFTFGNFGRNRSRADGFANLDLSIFRQFPLAESKMIEFRFEMFNATNSPTFGIPQQNWNAPTFGQVLSTRSSARQMQFGLKLYF